VRRPFQFGGRPGGTQHGPWLVHAGFQQLSGALLHQDAYVRMESTWLDHGKQAYKQLEESLPPLTLVNDAAILHDEALQDQLLKNPQRGSIVGCTNAVNLVHLFFKGVVVAFALSKEGREHTP
jgi:hypothetical protein